MNDRIATHMLHAVSLSLLLTLTIAPVRAQSAGKENSINHQLTAKISVELSEPVVVALAAPGEQITPVTAAVACYRQVNQKRN